MDERIKKRRMDWQRNRVKKGGRYFKGEGGRWGEFWIALQSLEGRRMSFRAYGFRPIERKEVLGEELVIASKL